MNSFGCTKCQGRHFEGDPFYQDHILHQSKHGISEDFEMPAEHIPAVSSPATQTSEGNLQIIYLYHALIDTQKLLQNELLPIAGFLRMGDHDPELYEAAERFCEALTRHLENNRFQISKVENGAK